jgi:hypothetical protein
MAGGFCEHGRIWTTCSSCGKDVIGRSKAGRRRGQDEPIDPLAEPAELRPRQVKKPPPEPPRTEFESDGPV